MSNTYPLVTVRKLAESRDFFVRHFGMSVVFEASWVAMLARKEGGPTDTSRDFEMTDWAAVDRLAGEVAESIRASEGAAAGPAVRPDLRLMDA